MTRFCSKLLAIAFSLLLCSYSFSQGETCTTATEVEIDIVYTDPGPAVGEGASNVCFGAGGTNANWYQLTASLDAVFTVSSSIDTDLPDTRVSIYNGICDALECIAQSDDEGEGYTSILTFIGTTGETYYIEWDDRWDNGEFDWIITAIDVNADTDEDGFPDISDNCPELANEDQADMDEDDIGDVCDEDIDGDGVSNDVDCDPMDGEVYQGAACDDGDPATFNDLLQDDCSCLGMLPPVNADCLNATLVDMDIVYTDPGPYGGEGAANVCFGGGGTNANWYAFTPSDYFLLTVSSSIDPDLPDTRVSVYTGTCDDLICIAQSDDEGEGYTSILTFEGLQGTTYYIEWDDRWNNGEFDWIITGEVITEDTDGDGILDVADNCFEISNPDQFDMDGDGLGDVCDEDIDGDQSPNDVDCDPLDASVYSGADCDDGDSATLNDIITSDCDCVGVIPPTNTECIEAQVVTVGSYVDPGPFVGAGSSNSCFGAGGTNSNWYVYTADGWGAVTIGSDQDPDLIDTRLSVFTGACDELDCLVFDDDDGAGLSSLVTFPVEDGSTYWIEWDDRWSQSSFDWYIDFVTGIDENDVTDSGLSVYPNPADHMLNLSFTMNKSAIVRYEIYDVSGKLILAELNAQNQGLVRSSLDVNGLKNGMYLLTVLIDDQMIKKRFDIQK